MEWKWSWCFTPTKLYKKGRGGLLIFGVQMLPGSSIWKSIGESFSPLCNFSAKFLWNSGLRLLAHVSSDFNERALTNDMLTTCWDLTWPGLAAKSEFLWSLCSIQIMKLSVWENDHQWSKHKQIPLEFRRLWETLRPGFPSITWYNGVSFKCPLTSFLSLVS